MSAVPPLAVDRLTGLAGVSKHLVEAMEKEGKLPRMRRLERDRDLDRIESTGPRSSRTEDRPALKSAAGH